MMELHYRVRTVVRTSGSQALTLVPVAYYRESDTETETVNGETFPKLVRCSPSDPGAEPDAAWSNPKAMTELRFEEVENDSDDWFDPDDYITITVRQTAAE